MYKELADKLREHAQWAAANEWETPITLGDDLSDAAEAIDILQSELELVKRERDAAMDDLRNLAIAHKTCYGCVNDKFNYNTDACAGCQYNSGHNWQWRGVTDTSKEG